MTMSLPFLLLPGLFLESLYSSSSLHIAVFHWAASVYFILWHAYLPKRESEWERRMHIQGKEKKRSPRWTGSLVLPVTFTVYWSFSCTNHHQTAFLMLNISCCAYLLFKEVIWSCEKYRKGRIAKNTLPYKINPWICFSCSLLQIKHVHE